MAVSYLGHFFLPLCPQCSQCFIAHHLHIQLRISQLRFLLLSLPPYRITALMTSSHHYSVNVCFDLNDSLLLKLYISDS